MPRVSDEHRQARRAQILDAAATTFAAQGFQATGMAEVIAASGLSAGAVYSYFSSKDDLIEAIVDRVLDEAAGRFDAVLDAGDPLDAAGAVRIAVETIESVAARGPVDVSRLAVQAWGEALRNPAVLGVARHAYGRLRGFFAEVLRRQIRAGALPAELDVDDAAAALLSLALGFLLQRLLMGDVDAAGYAAAVDGLLGAAVPAGR